MALTVPLPREELRPVGGEFTSNVSPEAASAPARQAGQLGGALTQQAQQVGAFADKLQNEEDLQRVQSADANYKSEFVKWQEAARTRRGVAAETLPDEFAAWHKETTEKLGTGFTSQRQRQAFSILAQKNHASGYHDTATFVLGEKQRAGDEAYAGQIANGINLGAIASTDTVVNDRKAEVSNAVRAYGAVRGWAPAKLQAELEAKLTEFHKQRIQHLAQTDPAAASEYYEENKGEIAGSFHAELGKVAENATSRARASDGVDSVWSELGPKGDSAPVEADKMGAKLRALFRNDPHALALATADMDHRIGAFKNAAKDRRAAPLADVHLAVMGRKSSAEIQKMPQFATLDNEQQAGVIKLMRELDYQDEARGAARASRLASDAQRANANEERAERRMFKANFGAYLQYSNPEVLAGMQRNEVINLLPSLGPQAADDLVKRWDQIRSSPKAAASAKIDHDLFNALADTAGLRPFDPTKSETQRAALGLAKKNVDDALTQARAAKGVDLTRDEREDVARKVLSTQVQKGGLSGFFGSTAPIASMTTAQVLSAMPREERAKIVDAAMRALKRKPTDDEIARAWYAKQQNKAVE